MNHANHSRNVLGHAAKRPIGVAAVAAIGIGLLAAAPAQAAFVAEYFNDLGSSDVELDGIGSGFGWDGNWTADPNNPNAPDEGEGYRAGDQLGYTAAGYSNLGNESDSSDGLVSYDSGGGADVSMRSLDSPLSGTIWVSFLANPATQDDAEVWVYFNAFTGDRSNRVGVVSNTDASVGVDGTNTKNDETVVAGETSLMLAKIVLNGAGNNDEVSLWANPDLSGGEGGLPSADVFVDGQDMGFSQIYLISIGLRRGGGGGSQLDALRISDDPTAGFGFVTTGVIPEPATLALLGLGGAVMLSGRKRRA